MKSDVNKAPRGEDDNQYDLFGGPEGATYRPGGNAYAAARAGELVDAANEQQNGSASHGAGDDLVATSATPPAPTQSKPERKKGDIPCGFVLKDDGVYYEVPSKGDDEVRLALVCGWLKVLAITRSKGNDNYGHLIEFVDKRGNRKRITIPSATTGGDGKVVINELLGLGLFVAPGKQASDRIIELLRRWNPPADRITCSHFGWLDDEFEAYICGVDRVIGDQSVAYQPVDAPAVEEQSGAGGTMEGWRKGTAALSVNNPIMAYSICHALAGPLLRPLDAPGGGLHFVGASGKGKTTSLYVANSVWGGEKNVSTWRATKNGLEGIAWTSNDRLLALDELDQIEAREAPGVSYMLLNGKGKTRANQYGSIRATRQWRTRVISSGEISLEDKNAEAGRRTKTGEKVRLLHVPGDERRYGSFDDLHDHAGPAQFAEAVRSMAFRHYGHAGPAFVENLIKDVRGTVVKTKRLRDEFIAEAMTRYPEIEGDSQVMRVLREQVAVTVAAGELATAWGITGWPEGEATRAGLVMFDLWLDRWGGAGQDELKQAIERVRDFISLHGSTRFTVILNDGTKPGDIDKPSRPSFQGQAGWWHPKAGLYYFNSPTWRIIHAGSNPTQSARLLAEADLMVTEGGRNQKKPPRGVPHRPWCYAVKVEILEVDQSADDRLSPPSAEPEAD